MDRLGDRRWMLCQRFVLFQPPGEHHYEYCTKKGHFLELICNIVINQEIDTVNLLDVDYIWNEILFKPKDIQTIKHP